MMAGYANFEEVLDLLESHGWKLQKIWNPYRVFVKEGQLPILIPVHNGKVDIEYVEKIEKILEEQE